MEATLKRQQRFWSKSPIEIPGADTITFTPDFSQVTPASPGKPSIDISLRNGYPAGILKEITIDITGTVSGSLIIGKTGNWRRLFG